MSSLHPDTKAGRDERTPSEFEAALWRATDISLRNDPERWCWKSVMDTRHHTSRDRAAAMWDRGEQPRGYRGRWAKDG